MCTLSRRNELVLTLSARGMVVAKYRTTRETLYRSATKVKPASWMKDEDVSELA